VANAWQFWIRERTIDDVKVFLRKIDWDDLQEVFDGAREQYVRRTQTGHHIRRTMRGNLLKAREFLSRMSHNAHIVHQWSNTELKNLLKGASDFSPDMQAQLREIAQMAADFRSLSRMRRIRLTLWITLRADQWPLGQIPSIASLRNLGANGELDLILLYQELKKAAAKLALPYGQQFHDEVLTRL
jgi:hypothetical protein